MPRSPRSLERRNTTAEQPAVTDGGKIRGTAVVFDSPTIIGSGPLSFRERVAPGAVTKTLRESDVVLLDNHDPARPIARKSAGTLDVQAQGHGVTFEADPADTTYAHDVVANVRAGNYAGMSFGFEVVKDKWAVGEDGVDERTLLEIKMPEISNCTFPAYPDTEIGMRDAYERGIEARDRYYEGRAGDAPGNGKKPYGNETYADPKNGKYPLTKNGKLSSERIHAAWAYINVAKNADEYPMNGVTLSSVKARIKAAAKKIGMTISSDNEKNAALLADMDLRGYTPERGFAEERADGSEGSDGPDDSCYCGECGAPNTDDSNYCSHCGTELTGDMERSAEQPETRDDPDGKEYAAMDEAIAHLKSGDADAALSTLSDCRESGDGGPGAEGGGMVAHTDEGGASVPVRSVSAATLNRAADALSKLPETPQSREALKIIGEVAVAVEPRTLQRAYDLVRELSPTVQSNEALSTLEPLIDAAETAAAEGERSTPKPEVSTSVVTRDSDSGRELAKRFEALQHVHRP